MTFFRPRTFSSARIGALAVCALFSLVCAIGARAAAPEQHASVASINFRAVGYGPRWLFEVDREGELRFVANADKAIVQLSATGLSSSTRSSGVIYGAHTDRHELLAEIVEVTCLDAISGERLTHTVTIRLNGREYRGCGRGFGAGETADQ